VEIGLILVTGGLGFIGSHTCLELLSAGFEIAIVDNLSNAKRTVATRLRDLAGRSIPVHIADLRDTTALDGIFARHDIDAVIHFAGLKSVAESVRAPLDYFQNNVSGTLSLLEVMARRHVLKIVFSSSATVYGVTRQLPIRESEPLKPASPYGRTKQYVEGVLDDIAQTKPGFRSVILRYFNPAGAHASGTLGEDPKAMPENLVPRVCQVAAGRLPVLKIFGTDYQTPDGTCIRDYIHITDLALGHVAALRHLERHQDSLTVNLGTGRGHSVFEVIRAFESATGIPAPYQIAPRRPGDVPASYADVSLAATTLQWKAVKSLEEMCRDAWRWQTTNPHGFPDAADEHHAPLLSR
jgi:UDP-glucose 4-epimerase